MTGQDMTNHDQSGETNQGTVSVKTSSEESKKGNKKISPYKKVTQGTGRNQGTVLRARAIRGRFYD